MTQFFEAIDRKHTTCFDLYGEKYIYTGYQKLVTCRSNLPYRCIGTYGLQMKPHEMKDFMEIPGNCIYVYDLKEKGVANKKSVDLLGRLNYYNLYNPNTSTAFDLYTHLLKKQISYMWGRRKNLVRKIRCKLHLS